MRFLTSLLSIALLPALALAEVAGLQLPPGFDVAEYADNRLASDIYCMTVDPHGRVVVAGRGYIRALVEGKDGRAESAIDVAKEPRDGAMGLLWEEDGLYFTGDGGLRRFHLRDGRPDGPSQLIRAMKTGGEHAAHAICRGPDGWLYVLAGNNTGIDAKFAQTPGSPIRDPIAGCVLRFSPDLKRSEIVADGFRNAYGMDFNLDGALFTFDSDNERCVSLPWYEPTRLYHVRPGGHYGWLNPQRADFWRRPPYFCDVIAPVATLGRGSPTAVVCYRHTQFPERYRGGLFLADWTFGKLHFARLQHAGDSYSAQTEVFLSTTGDTGFAPTAAVVRPQTGDLFVSIGGRGTRGGVYRIRYTARPASAPRAEPLPIKPVPQTAVTACPAMSAEEASAALTQATTPGKRLAAIRQLQLALGDVGGRRGTIWEGYVPARPVERPADPSDLPSRLAALFPSGDSDLDRELARTLGMLAWADQALRDKVLERLSPTSDPVEDIHYLAVFARLPGRRSERETQRVVASLLGLGRKIEQRKLQRDHNWPPRVAELYAGLALADPALEAALVASADFGRPDHAIFTRAPGFNRSRAAPRFLAALRKDSAYALNADAIALLAALPADEVAPVLRARWGETGYETELLPALAGKPLPEDGPRLVRGLGATDARIVRACLRGLDALGDRAAPAELTALVQALRRQSDRDLRQALAARLTRLTGQALGTDGAAWLTWFQGVHPEMARRLTNPDGVDVGAWDRRLARLGWDDGNPEAGRQVFAKASCVSCHSGGQALGPDLNGVAQRFSRADLLTAILQPSRDVPERYRSTVVETRDGKVTQGLVIYDAVDSLILQTGASTTVRLDGRDVTSRRPAELSLMPAGLLDPLSDRDIVDLIAYLRSLGKR